MSVFIDEASNVSRSFSNNFFNQRFNDEKVNVIKSIILALNTSYHVGLKNEKTRKEYRNCISRSFNNRKIDENYISEVINECYEIFLDEICLPPAIARNQVIYLTTENPML